MHIIRVAILSVLLASPVHSQGQQDGCFSISGTVVNSADGSPVSSPVRLKAKGFLRQTKTDSLGRYAICGIPTGEYRLLIGLSRRWVLLDTVLAITSSLTVNAMEKVICHHDADSARQDIQAGRPRLLLASGFGGWAKTPEDVAFEKTYGVTYFDFGDTLEDDPVCVRVYNSVVFEYLDTRFGTSWRSKVSPWVLPTQTH